MLPVEQAVSVVANSTAAAAANPRHSVFFGKAICELL
jgi:hypothetical protein